MSLLLSQFHYDLNAKYIAQFPVTPRDSSKLLTLDRNTQELAHWQFSDLPQLLQPGDLIVRNNTKVLPARLFGIKTTGGKVEVLLNRPLAVTNSSDEASTTWECLTKPGLKVGQQVVFGATNNSASLPAQLQAECIGIGTDGYSRTLRFTPGGTQFFSLLDKVGKIPFPPYVTAEHHTEALKEQYQTTYATQKGSVAAPTAGLHFTRELDSALLAKGVTFAEVTLHVGMGTFLPVKTAKLSEHHMHAESFELSKKNADCINEAKQQGRRILAVGTTTIRVLESCSNESGIVQEKTGETDIFIYPPYRYKIIDGIITNYHLPESTLLMLVSAFVSQPNTTHSFKDFLITSVGSAYQTALKNNYRFYSFGDAMLIL
jgi:S-adenosylmethionine:tRNA ribosyltransferase-isomerase